MESARFAMGAMGGFFANASRQPTLQIEGLVADRALIEHLRRQDPLDEVLASYGVDYLVVSVLPAISRSTAAAIR